MLRKLWYRRDAGRVTSSNINVASGVVNENPIEAGLAESRSVGEPICSADTELGTEGDHQTHVHGFWSEFEGIGADTSPSTLGLGNDMAAFPSIEEYLFGSFRLGYLKNFWGHDVD